LLLRELLKEGKEDSEILNGITNVITVGKGQSINSYTIVNNNLLEFAFGYKHKINNCLIMQVLFKFAKYIHFQF
jgi:hypothetical protein